MLPFVTIIVPTYTLMAFLGGTACLFYEFFRLEKFPAISFSFFLKIYGTAVCSGLLGSKFLYWLVMLPVQTVPLTSLNLITFYVESGYVFYGGLLGVLTGVYLLCRTQKEVDAATVFQFIAPAFPLFHGFGRIGCMLAGCCYGVLLSNPIEIFDMYKVVRMPTQLIESIFEFILFGVLHWTESRLTQGSLLPLYLACYSVFRFFIEFLRADPDRGIWFGLSTSQWISLGILTVVFLVQKKRQLQSKSGT